jgi:hypothetical protein
VTNKRHRAITPLAAKIIRRDWITGTREGLNSRLYRSRVEHRHCHTGGDSGFPAAGNPACTGH